MRKRKETVATPSIDRSHIVSDEGRAGEIVGVRGERGAFTIIRECWNTRIDKEWVELWDKEHSFRAVRPERIVKRRQPRR